MKTIFFLIICFLLFNHAALADYSYDNNAAACADIKCVRAHIDVINDQILELLSERTAYVRRAGILKGPSHPANDPARVRSELAAIAAKSSRKHLPVEISVRTFKALIQSSIEYQQRFKDHYFGKMILP
jgi:isochorismate pyruvate lyase